MIRSRATRWALAVSVLLIGWALRLVHLEEVPPGWRDDELINIHALSSQVLDGELPLYYVGASGHEPLYHHLHAGVHAVLGFNVLSGHILSVMFGMLSIALTYSLVRRLFPGEQTTAIVASLTLASSFWSLMYSRTAIRHISLPPLALVTVYVFWRQIRANRSSLPGWGLVGLLLAATLYTYTASRLLPFVLGGFVGYLALLHGDRFRKHRKGMVLALTVMALLVAPLGIAIARNRTRSAIEGIGADARVTELAGPLRALQEGDPGPVIASTAKTLGMFHASGDPEWLYNISGRPVFNLLGGILLWTGVILCLYRWRDPRYFLLLPWLAVGLSPAFVSTPPASLGHTILAQPVAYILPALALTETRRVFRRRRSATDRASLPAVGAWALVLLFVVTNGIRDLDDYFKNWPQHEMVQILYRADYREIAGYVNAQPRLEDLAVTSTLLGPWDRLALDVDMRRDDVAIRLFDPGRALIWVDQQTPSRVVLTPWPPADPAIRGVLEPHSVSSETVSSRLTMHELSPIDTTEPAPQDSLRCGSTDDAWESGGRVFANGLELTRACWVGQGAAASNQETMLLTMWTVTRPLELPAMPIVANPPPPQTYAGPRLAVFAHLVPSDAQTGELSQADGVTMADDGLWVDPLTLRPGDRFIQIHRFDGREEVFEEFYAVALGLYDPMTGERWPILDSAGNPITDHVMVRSEDPS